METSDNTQEGRHAADEQLAALLATGLSIKQAAKKAHVSESTAHRRLLDPAFTARVDELRSGLVKAALHKLEGAMSGAADVLRELCAHDEPHVRIRAAVEILRHTLRVKEAHDLSERLARLETLLQERGQREQSNPFIARKTGT